MTDRGPSVRTGTVSAANGPVFPPRAAKRGEKPEGGGGRRSEGVSRRSPQPAGASPAVTAPDFETLKAPLVAGADVTRFGVFERVGATISYMLWDPERQRRQRQGRQGRQGHLPLETAL